MGPHTEAGKKEIWTNPGIEHHPACALNEREVLWKKLGCGHVIPDFIIMHSKRETGACARLCGDRMFANIKL